MKSSVRHSIAASLLISTGCATAGATFRSGVAPASFDRPPYYAGAAVTAGGYRIAHLPIHYQRGSQQPALFEPAGGPGSPAASVVAEMNTLLDSIGGPARVGTASSAAGTPPDVHFGCLEGLADSCVGEGEDVSTENRRLHLSVGRPSEEWIAWAGRTLDSASADYLLLVTMEVGQYWPRQKGLSLAKEVRLGTGYAPSIPWLTSLEQPVAVVQLTGALVGRDGRAVRIGAEGLMARRSNIVLSAIGGQMLVSDEDIAHLRTARREDLPGQPLVWQVALRHLVSQLTGRP